VKEFAFYLRRFALNAENKTMPSEKFQTAFVCHAYDLRFVWTKLIVPTFAGVRHFSQP
jgi:hypothetical protein